MVKFTAAVVALVLLASGSADAFSTGGASRCGTAPTARSSTHLFMAPLPSPEESAKALSDYMAKSHEEKLRAVKTAEENSAAQIESLQKEIDTLKTSRESSVVQASVPPPEILPEGSKEELAAKLAAYQKFMTEYIVKAHEQKYLAVKAAEAAVELKYEEKLLLLGAVPPAAPAVAAVELAAPSQNAVFAERNARVSAAAKAGKSRWGDMENQRAAGVTVTMAPAAASVAPAPVDAPVPPEVEAADHGLRADGGVGGPSLADRVARGSGAAAPAAAEASTPVLSESQAIFQKRNARVSAAAKAGKSRWGDMENQRAAGVAVTMAPTAAVAPAAPALVDVPVPPSPVDAPVPPEVVAADHGLRADGGVGGPSLADRVARGSGAAAPAAAGASTPVLSESQAIFQKRNALVSAAGKAGKSRWGDMEVKRSAEFAANALPAAPAAAAAAISTTTPSPAPITVAAVPVPPEVEAADHGLRADGGVGGLTLAQRVSLGAAANGAAAAVATAPALSANQAIFQKRNALVSAAGKAGKSRWGDMEIHRAADFLATALPANGAAAEIEAADHGLSADGGVGGPSLGDRVNLGAQLLQNA